MTAKNTREAWSIADRLFPTDYLHDSNSSRRAGYDIYRSTAAGVNAWISDLGNRLEVNLPDGQTVNVWIEDEATATATESAEDENVRLAIEARHSLQRWTPEALFSPEVCQHVTICVEGDSWASDDERAVYEALRRGDPCVALDIVTRYAEAAGIAWGTISHTSAHHVEHGTGAGHFIVGGLISARIGSEAGFMAKCAALLAEKAERDKL